MFSERDEEMAEDKAKYNFAFFMILFVFGTTGSYYVFTTLKNKFFPQSNVSEYLKNKRWRYWDRSQVRITLNLGRGETFFLLGWGPAWRGLEYN